MADTGPTASSSSARWCWSFSVEKLCSDSRSGTMFHATWSGSGSRSTRGEFDEEVEAADLLREYKAKVAALERLVGRQALEIEFSKGAKETEARRKNAPMCAVAGPSACPSPGDVS